MVTEQMKTDAQRFGNGRKGYNIKQVAELLENAGGGYTAGTGISISDEKAISVDTTEIQEKLTAGNGITISEDNVISLKGWTLDTEHTTATTIRQFISSNSDKYEFIIKVSNDYYYAFKQTGLAIRAIAINLSLNTEVNILYLYDNYARCYKANLFGEGPSNYHNFKLYDLDFTTEITSQNISSYIDESTNTVLKPFIIVMEGYGQIVWTGSHSTLNIYAGSYIFGITISWMVAAVNNNTFSVNSSKAGNMTSNYSTVSSLTLYYKDKSI